MTKFPKLDLTKAAQELAGVHVGELDVDWLAVDEAGRIAVFLGDHASPIPLQGDPAGTAIALEIVTRRVPARIAAATTALGYRGLAREVHQPVFDAPRAAPGEALHEPPFEGYPHLVVATVDGAEVVRRLMDELGGREVHARDAYAAVLDRVGFISYEELHQTNACGGCRVIDNPKDPHPRAPEMLATAGLYVYGHAAVGRSAWLRMASPGRPLDRRVLVAMADSTPALQPLPARFEDAPWIHLGEA